MDQITSDALWEWLGDHWIEQPSTVGVKHSGDVPLAELQDLVAVLGTGHNYYGALSSSSPYLLPAFIQEALEHHSGTPAGFVEADDLFHSADSVIVTGTDETVAWAKERCEESDIPADRRLLRGDRYSVAVIDGDEAEGEREGLAEDMLVHAGYGRRNVALLWAPRDLSPDPYLEAMAQCRAMFPVHDEVPGTLQMQQAFLEAQDQPHAYGEGLEFLMSRGEPEVQRPGHIRWTEYEALGEAREWLREHQSELQVIVARPQVADRLIEGAPDLPVVSPGDAQRPSLGQQPKEVDPVAFLSELSA